MRGNGSCGSRAREARLPARPRASIACRTCGVWSRCFTDRMPMADHNLQVPCRRSTRRSRHLADARKTFRGSTCCRPVNCRCAGSITVASTSRSSRGRTWKRLAAKQPAVWQALRDWVASGPTLCVYEMELSDQQLAELEALLGMAGSASTTRDDSLAGPLANREPEPDFRGHPGPAAPARNELLRGRRGQRRRRSLPRRRLPPRRAPALPGSPVLSRPHRGHADQRAARGTDARSRLAVQ